MFYRLILEGGEFGFAPAHPREPYPQTNYGLARMSKNPGESIANPIGAADAAQFQDSVSRGATYKVRFSKFWTSNSRRQNSFDLSGRGEIA
jgi:hypothetical protein